MLTVFEDSEKIFRALAAGASGYLLKRQRPEELLAAIREVVAGGAPMSTSIARKVVKSFQSAPPRGTESPELSPRELEVLQALAQGLAYKQIADQLNVSIHTVRNYIRRVYEKLHVRSRTEAVVKFLKT
jgi:DNA-binding NarL/FixJ family response regulator